METQAQETAPTRQYAPWGTVLEAAFVDPAYQWPPPEGEGRNAIELQASISMLDDGDSVKTTDSMRKRMEIPPRPSGLKNKLKPWYKCCSDNDAAMMSLKEWEDAKRKALATRKEHHMAKKQREKEIRKRQKYNRVPEGILIYRLDTSTQTLTLMSDPSNQTDLKTLVKEMVVMGGKPGSDKSRRGMTLTGDDGNKTTLVACEQRTAISWLEAIDLMLANRGRVGENSESREWHKHNLNTRQLDQIEGQYLNLANYSNKIIRADGKKKNSGGAGGIYYSIEVSKDPADHFEEEALESIAKRRAVIKDSWDFYRMICSLLRDRRKYDEVFRKLQHDPVYPYLHSMTGLNDPGDAGYKNADKTVIQRDLPKYADMTREQVAEHLVGKAQEAMPSLVEICKALAGSLGMEEVGLGPVKEVTSAMKKAEKKYDGDLLMVTDYCRALLVVRDFPSLLALLELARDSFGPLIRRVKLTTLMAESKPKPGGYRDCIINVELKEHICEIQVHLWPLWTVCGIDGFRHYRHCLEYSTDSFGDPYDALDGLDRKTMAELIVMAEEAVADTPLDSLEWFQEKLILDYFAEVGLFVMHGLHVWAEITLRHLIRLRTESPDIGPEHHETILLYKNLALVLRSTGKKSEAAEIVKRVNDYESKLKTEKTEAEKSVWDNFLEAPQDVYDMVMDPSRKEREEEDKLRKEVKASKKQWRRIRRERFAFLDSGDGNDRQSSATGMTTNVEEKKIEESTVGFGQQIK